MRDIVFATDEYYHVFNRGVDRRVVYGNPLEHLRFYESMYLFNDANYSHEKVKGDIRRDTLLAASDRLHIDRDCLVSIASFCLMPNHYHICLRQIQDGGISKFMQKLDMGYTNHFNWKYDRSGALFEGPFKAVHIDNDAYFQHIPRYIHLNALDLIDPSWRDGKIDDWGPVKQWLDDYRWSSHCLFDGRRQMYEVVNRDELAQFCDNVEDYRTFIKSWTGRSTMPYETPDTYTFL